MNQSKLFCFAIVFLASACTTPPALIEKQALNHGFVRSEIFTEGFSLVVYQKKKLCAKNNLHIYFAGDGIPWQFRNSVAIDPTPPHELALDLMAADQTASILLGRPCYYGTRNAPACHPMYWTHARYSEIVVDSMVDALKQLLSTVQESCKVTLIGFSGGGTLAMLMASRIPQVAEVITIAGNLDIAAWARFHDYSPLLESLNPADLDALPSKIKQWHLLAGADQEIPPTLVGQVIQSQSNARILFFEDFSHDCCWQSIWPAMLEKLSNSE